MPPGIAALSFEQQRLTPYGTNIQGLAKSAESFPRKRESPFAFGMGRETEIPTFAGMTPEVGEGSRAFQRSLLSGTAFREAH
jgi:hypothetical protein